MTWSIHDKGDFIVEVNGDARGPKTGSRSKAVEAACKLVRSTTPKEGVVIHITHHYPVDSLRDRILMAWHCVDGRWKLKVG